MSSSRVAVTSNLILKLAPEICRQKCICCIRASFFLLFQDRSLPHAIAIKKRQAGITVCSHASVLLPGGSDPRQELGRSFSYAEFKWIGSPPELLWSALKLLCHLKCRIQSHENLHLAYWKFRPRWLTALSTSAKLAWIPSWQWNKFRLVSLQKFFPTSSCNKRKIERFNRLTTVIMAVRLSLHNRVNPMNSTLYLAEVRQLVSGSSKTLSVPSDTTRLLTAPRPNQVEFRSSVC